MDRQQHNWAGTPNRRKRLTRTLQPRPVLTAPGQQWSIDFASDVTASGRRLRVLSAVDSFTRQCHVLEVDTSFPSGRVTRVLGWAIVRFGKPETIRCDNGPELCSRHFLAWAIERKIDVLHIRPGKPTENAYVESFHGRLRDECLNTNWFWNLFVSVRSSSYETLTRVFGGTYLNVGLKNPGFTINPFSLDATHENMNFLYLFLRVLIEAGGRYELTMADEKALFAAIERAYKLPPEISMSAGAKPGHSALRSAAE